MKLLPIAILANEVSMVVRRVSSRAVALVLCVSIFVFVAVAILVLRGLFTAGKQPREHEKHCEKQDFFHVELDLKVL
jgi:hypothetical protein